MQIHGAKVQSAAFGSGVITEQSESTVTIDFNGVEKKFLYPFGFEKHLVAEDPAIQEVINSEIASAEAKIARRQRFEKHHAMLKAAQLDAKTTKSSRKK